jgi:hypothetical protein
LERKKDIGSRADQLCVTGKKLKDKFDRTGGRPNGRNQVRIYSM